MLRIKAPTPKLVADAAEQPIFSPADPAAGNVWFDLHALEKVGS